MTSSAILLFGAVFAIAMLYASVGHGGASGYLALLALFGAEPSTMKPTALVLNLFVSLAAFFQFYRAGFFRPRIFWPLALVAMPLAYWGGTLTIDDAIYRKILGATLLVPAARFLFPPRVEPVATRAPNLVISVPAGAGIGFLSGLIGIGGGILLSPLLLLLRWTTLKEAAAISALFIFVNSAAGLAGQIATGVSFAPEMAVYVALTLAGGGLGARLGAFRFADGVLKKALALVLGIAAFKLLFPSPA